MELDEEEDQFPTNAVFMEREEKITFKGISEVEGYHDNQK